MTSFLEGGCRCGAVRYTIDVQTVPRSYACHCHQCQRWSGSAFSQNFLVQEDLLKVAGPITLYELKTKDRISSQRICTTCHTRIYNTNTRRPGFAVVRAGTLDRSEELQCAGHIFTATKQAWVVIPPDVPSWPEAASPQEFLSLLFG